MAEEVRDMAELEEDTLKGKYLIFSLDNEEYGIELKHVTEIKGIPPITPVPELPVYIKGVINLRGRIIPVMDVRMRFKKEPRAYDDRTCIIVIEIMEVSIGLVIDRVLEVISIPDEEISPPPQFSKGFHSKYIKGIGKADNKVKLLLDCEKLLEDNEVEVLSEVR